MPCVSTRVKTPVTMRTPSGVRPTGLQPPSHDVLRAWVNGGIDGTCTRFLCRDRAVSRLLRPRPHDSTSPAGRSSPAPETPVGFSGTRLRPLYTGPSTSRRVFTSTSVVRARPRHQPPVAERHGTSWGGCPLPSGAFGPGPCLVPGTCNPAQGALHTLRNSSNGVRYRIRTCRLLVRSQALYPDELTEHEWWTAWALPPAPND